MRKLLTAFVIMTLYFAASGISFSDNIADLKVGIYPNEPLLFYENEEAKGFMVDLINEIASREGWTVEYVPYAFDEGLLAVESGSVDMMVGVAYSEEREKRFDFNDVALFVNWGQIYTHPTSGIESLQDLQSSEIGVMKGDIHYIGENGLKNTLDQFGITPIYREYDQKSDMLSDLEKKSIDAVIVNRTYGAQNASNYDVEKTPLQLNPVNMHIIFQKGTGAGLAQVFDTYLSEWKADKQSLYYSRLENWLSGTMSERTPLWVWPAISGGLVLLVLAGLLIGFARRVICKQTLELRELNHSLEQKVRERTMDLDAANQHLKASMLSLEEKQAELEEMNAILEEQVDVIERTQSSLIESEKMASLGRMVASMAHELNTPIGICVTLHSNMKLVTKRIRKALADNKLCKSELTEYLDDQLVTQAMFENNIDSVVGLVERFKMLSNDRIHINERKINLHNYLHMQLESMSPELKRSAHEYKIECPKDIDLVLDPAALTQVIRNLTMNSLLHGFEEKNNGKIEINVKKVRERVLIEYKDDGKGITEDVRGKMFEPFYTTKRNRGGTGLGLSIVHSAVTKTMDGEIRVDTLQTNGLKYEIELPLRDTESPNFSVPNKIGTINRSEDHESTS